ncbi:MAG: glycosyltransferase 87 family protein [Candidatus Bathyarchaeia archaeon]
MVHSLESTSRARLVALILSALAVKTLCSATTFSVDFKNLSLMASFTRMGIYFNGPYTFSGYLMNIFYRIWMWLPVEHVSPIKALEFTMSSPTPGVVGYILALKSPIILFDLLTGWVVYKSILELGGKRREAVFGLALWLFNPYLTLSIEMDGTIDVVSAFFLTLAMYLYLKRRDVFSGLSLAVGAFARFYPAVFLPFFLISTWRRGGWRRMTRVLAGFSAGFVAAALPFIAKFQGRFIALLMELPVGGNREFTWFFGHFFTVNAFPETRIGVVAVIYTLLLIMLTKIRGDRPRVLIDATVILLVGFLAFSHWNRYYSIWVTPLVTLDYAASGKSGFKAYRAMFTLLFLGWFLFGARWHVSSFFHIRYVPEILAPMRNAVVEGWEWLSSGYLLETFSRAMLAAVSTIYMIYLCLRTLNFNGFQFMVESGQIGFAAFKKTILNKEPGFKQLQFRG